MRFFSMFSGIGGFELGISRAVKHSECVGYSEINKYAIQVYSRHFPTHKNYGDAARIEPDILPDFDVLCGGFPCQAFSIAGRRGGFEDTRGTLFFEVARIARVKRPKLLFLENVKGILSHNNGKTFGTILSTLSDMGYVCEWQVLNSKDFGVPQNRERVFIIGHLGGICRRAIFPIGSTDKVYSIPRKAKEKIHNIAQTLTARQFSSWNDNYVEEPSLGYVGAVMTEKNKKWLEDGKELSRNFPQGQRVYDASGISTTIASQAGGLGAKTGLYLVHNLQPRTGNPKKGGTGHLSKRDGTVYCLDTSNTQAIEKNQRIRRLTPLECERLQGFPDGWTEGLSDTQRYKCLGNAVTVPVIEAIAKRF